jgi:ectoine hydroxylase-related dioxygenase (phytanoyl-CoA dioxygenase family)
MSDQGFSGLNAQRNDFMDYRSAIDQSGFAVMDRTFPTEQLDRLLEEINRSTSRRTRAGIRHALGLLSVAAFAQSPQLMEVASAVLGQSAFPFRATLFDKSAKSNWLVVWHQDTALPLQSRQDVPGWGPWSIKAEIDYAHAPASVLSQVLALRVHLDDSNARNGPLRILPATHMLGVMSDDTIHDLTTKIAPVDCIAPKGGIVAMRPLVVHASSKSDSDRPRRVLHIEYAGSPSIAAPLELAIA